MTKTTKFIALTKQTTLVTTTPYGWFYSEGKSVKCLHNNIHNTLAIVIPEADCHLQIKLTGTAFKKESTLLKEYAKACVKFNIKNIFA